MSLDIGGVIGRTLVPVAVAVVFAASRRFLPAKKTGGKADLEEAGRMPYVAIAMVVVGLAIAFGSYYLLKLGNAAWASKDAPFIISILPGTAIWWFFPLFGGLSLCWEVTRLLMQVVLGQDAAEGYAAWSDAKSGFRSTSVLRLMAYFIALPISGFTLLAIPMHANLNDGGISIGRYARWATERHAYSDVYEFYVRDGIRLRDGGFQSEPSVILRFRDGSEWSSWTLTESRTIDTRLVEFLAQHIGRQPEHRETD